MTSPLTPSAARAGAYLLSVPTATITWVRDSAHGRPGTHRFADLMISALPPDPTRLATKDDVAVLGADLRVEMRDLTSQQTRTLMVGLVLSITALAITQIVLATLG